MIRFLAFIRSSLRTRLLLFTILIGVVVIGMMVFIGVSVMGRNFEKQVRDRIEVYGRVYTMPAALSLFSRDYGTLRDILEGWQNSSKDMVYTAVTSVDGQMRIASNWPTQEPLPEPGYDSKNQIWHVSFPATLGNKTYGYLQYGLSTQFIGEIQRSVLRQIIGIACFGFFLLVSLQALGIYFLTKRLSSLSETSRRVGQGDFTQRLAIQGKDEIAVLASNFNNMVDMVQNRIMALEESEERFRAIANYTYDWENWFDIHGNLRWVNPAVERILGRTQEECLAMPDFPVPIIYPDDRELIRFQMQEAQDGMSGQDLEFRVLGAKGEAVWVTMSWQPIHDKNGFSLGYRSSIRDITAKHQAAEELAYQAIHDPLTGLFNRRAFERRLEQLFSRRQMFAADSLPVTLLFIDLDQFKIVNDTCGHSAGDSLLVGIVQVLQQEVGTGLLARLGGDEFGVILRHDANSAFERALRITRNVRNFSFCHSGRVFHIGASIGVASASPALNTSGKLLAAADAACYAAKERGRNRVELYMADDEYFRKQEEEFHSISGISDALKEGYCQLYYQRVKAIAPGLPAYAEILIRLNDSSGNIILPERFITMAEHFNLMSYVDYWVVENVCKQIAQWDAEGFSPDVECFSINISANSLTDPDFANYVVTELDLHKINPERLCFEIKKSGNATEEQIRAFIDRMRRLRVGLGLDDFGQGVDSFATLKRMKVDYIKIDKIFIEHLDENPADEAAVSAIVAFANVYGLKTVAKHVHNEAILKRVSKLGVDYAEGNSCHVPEALSSLRGAS